MSLQQRQLVGLSASSLLLLLLLLLSSHAANPALCARGGSFGLHPPLHQIRRSHAHDRSHISTGFNPLVRTPAGAHIQTPTVATSMKPTNSLDDNEDVVPTRPNSGTGRSIALSKQWHRRVLIEPLSKSNNVAVESGEDLILSLAGFKASTKDHNLFSMLPRAQRVPPSGPSKSHNSALTEKSS